MKHRLKRIISNIIVFYSTRYPKILAYMAQASQYQAGPYLKLLINTDDFSSVLPSSTSKPKPRSLAVAQGLRVGMILEGIAGLTLIIEGISHHVWAPIFYGAAVILAYPLIWPILLAIPLLPQKRSTAVRKS
ncbi:MAG TPA: hypothetical protein VMR95_03690 [Candidatus Binatia bacterium]|nr:hypothetical protein [Candidatus Binatia bacterium]